MCPFLLEDARLDDETARQVYKTSVGWAAEFGSRYELTLQPELYEDREALARLLALGVVSRIPSSSGRVARWLAADHDVECRVSGTDMDGFVRTMTDQTIAVRARSSELGPVEDAAAFDDDTRIYALFDYGRTQLVDGTDEQLTALRRRLADLSPEPLLRPTDDYGGM